ncbi:DNA primase, partial [Bacillus sp. D-CC]
MRPHIILVSETVFGEAGYLHKLAEEQKRGYDFSQDQMIKEHRKKSDYTLDIIYTLFLESLDVRDEHIKMLSGSKRRITKEVINVRNYKSFPIKPW